MTPKYTIETDEDIFYTNQILEAQRWGIQMLEVVELDSGGDIENDEILRTYIPTHAIITIREMR